MGDQQVGPSPAHSVTHCSGGFLDVPSSIQPHAVQTISIFKNKTKLGKVT